MKKTIIAVSADVPGNKKVYVKELSIRDDGNLLVVTTFEPGEAADLQSVARANMLIKKFWNPYDRQFQFEALEVNRTQAVLSSELS